MANRTAASWGAVTPSTKKGLLSHRTHFNGFRYLRMLKSMKTWVSTQKEFFQSFFKHSSFFVLCVLARSCSVIVLHWKWRKQRKEQSNAQCHVKQRIRIFEKISEHVKVVKSLYQRFPVHHSPGFRHDVCGEAGIENISTSSLQSTWSSN